MTDCYIKPLTTRCQFVELTKLQQHHLCLQCVNKDYQSQDHQSQDNSTICVVHQCFSEAALVLKLFKLFKQVRAAEPSTLD